MEHVIEWNSFNENKNELNIKSYLKDIYIKYVDYVIENDALWEPLWSTFEDILPTVTDEDGDDEELDLENFEVLEVTEDEVVMCAGGDWQTPVEFEISLKNNNIVLNELSNEFDDGMSFFEFIVEIFDGDTKNIAYKKYEHYWKTTWE